MKFSEYTGRIKSFELYFASYEVAKIPYEFVKIFRPPNSELVAKLNTEYRYRQTDGCLVMEIERDYLTKNPVFTTIGDNEYEGGNKSIFDRIIYAADILMVGLVYVDGIEEVILLDWDEIRSKQENALQKVILRPKECKETIEIIIGDKECSHH